MSEPLQDSDPRQLGAFRLRERMGAGAEGVVYLARDSAGRAVSVAVLSEGAAGDPAARDRFAAAVERGAGVADPPEVLASNTTNPAASWVAVRHSGEGPGAGAFLRPVGVGTGAGTARSPGYRPYWAGAHAPAAARWSWQGGKGGGAASPSGTNRAVVAGLLLLLLLFVALLVLLYMLLSQLSQQAMVGPEQPAPSPEQSESPPEGASPSPEDTTTTQPGQGREEEPAEPSPAQSPTGDVPTVPLDEENQEDLPEDPGGLH